MKPINSCIIEELDHELLYLFNVINILFVQLVDMDILSKTDAADFLFCNI